MDLNHPILLISKKEIMDNIRNKWIIALSIIFAILAIIVSYFGSYGQGWQSLVNTILGMMGLVQFLVPIIGLMLGYVAIVGEIEKGSLSALLSFPVQRYEIVVGKFIGLSCVLAISLTAGLGIGGIIIALTTSGENFGSYLVFLGATVLMGMVFISIALLFSALLKRRSTSMGMAIFLWFFFTMIYGMITAGIAFIIVGFDKIMTDGFPSWYYTISTVNPLSAYSVLVSMDLGITSGQDVPIHYPSFFSVGFLTIVLLIWIAVTLFLTIRIFKKREI